MFKVVTKENKSLGLRRNPTILYYPVGRWVKSPTVTADKADSGGIWVTRTLGGARTLQKYMKNKYNQKTKIFSCEIGEVLFGNTYRIKTDKVRIVEEI